MALKAGQADVREALAAMNRPSGRRNKYGAQKTVVDGFVFDSKREAKRWGELVLMVRAGEITDLMRQPAYEIVVAPLKGPPFVVAKFTADFFYRDQTGKAIVEDVKSPPTRKNTAYRLRKRLIEARYGFEIQEI